MTATAWAIAILSAGMLVTILANALEGRVQPAYLAAMTAVGFLSTFGALGALAASGVT